MKLLPTASLSNQQKTSCSAMGLVDSVICESWAAQTQGILLKILWAGHQHECLQHEHIQLCFYLRNGKEEGNKCNRKERNSRVRRQHGWQETIYNLLESLFWVICSAAQTAVQVCLTVLHPDTQAHQHSKLFGVTSFLLGCGNVSTNRIQGDVFLCLELNTDGGKIQIIMTRK